MADLGNDVKDIPQQSFVKFYKWCIVVASYGGESFGDTDLGGDLGALTVMTAIASICAHENPQCLHITPHRYSLNDRR